MKIAIVNDLHFGVRNGSSIFEAELKRFLNEDFFPYLQENGIRTTIVAGDLFDDRKQINIKTLNLIHGEFLDKLESYDIDVHMIPGNHDIYYKNTLQPNCIEPIVRRYENVSLYETPTVVDFEGYKMHFIPWICNDNEEECLNAINSFEANSLVTHTDIIGSQNVPGVFLESGFSLETFYKYDYVFNGHIHTRSQIGGNVHNLGTQYQFNWSDYGQKKGFHIFDTEKVELTFVPNRTDDLYVKIFYEDNLVSGVEPLTWLQSQHARLTNKFIKIILTGSIDRFTFDKFLSIINNDIRTYDVKIIEDVQNMFEGAATQDMEIIQSKSTLHIINEMIDEAVIDKAFDKNIVKSLMAKFYTEALNKGVFEE